MLKVFDWDKAARIIKANGYKDVRAGLSEDWFWTGGGILEDGNIVDEELFRCWVHSPWDTPVIRVYSEDGEKCHTEYPCFRETSDDYIPEHWPESARKILEE